MITAKIKFGILLCCLPMRFLIFSLVFLMLRIVFNVFSMMFAKTSLLFCCFCMRLFVPNYVCVVLYGVMRNLDAIIGVVWCFAKPRCYYSCPYGVLRNLDAIIRVRMVLCKTSMLLCVSNYVRLNPGLQRARPL